MNYELQSLIKQIAGRILFSLPLFVLGKVLLESRLAEHSLENGSGYGLVWTPFLSIACFAIAGFIIAPSVAQLIAYPITNLFYPTQSAEKPPPLYSVPEWLIKEGRIAEAIEEYEKIIRNHPQELQAHLALLQIFQETQPDRERGSKVYKRAMKELRSKRDRTVIKNAYRGV